MKKQSILFIVLIFVVVLYANSIEAFRYDRLVNTISRVTAPKIKDGYIIFTAKGNRHAGIAFEYEDYKNIYSFKKLVQAEFRGKEVEPVLFYIMEIPEGLREIKYRLVVDGLWSVDPQNSNSIFDYKNGMSVSLLEVPYKKEFKTCVTDDHYVKFTYLGEANQKIKLAGNFNNWDPFMYSLTEVATGRYEINLKLPKGTWTYAYFSGSTQLPDTTNRNFVYTEDGRVASVIEVN